MGLDFLDLMFQLEKRERVYVMAEAAVAELAPRFEEVEQGWLHWKKRDIRVGTFYEGLRGHCVGICAGCYPVWQPAAWLRKRKGEVKKRPEGTYVCTGCGRALERREVGWEAFCGALGEVVGKEAGRIREQQWMRKDLGFI